MAALVLFGVAATLQPAQAGGPVRDKLRDTSAVEAAVDPAEAVLGSCSSSGVGLVRSTLVSGQPWRVIRFRAQPGWQAEATIRFLGSIDQGALGTRVVLLDSNYHALSNSGTTGGGGATLRYTNGRNLNVGLSAPGFGCTGGLLAQSFPAGEYAALLIAASRGQFVGSFNLYGTGVEVLKESEGQTSFMRDAADFKGSNTYLEANGNLIRSEANYAVAPIHVNNTLFASFSAFAYGTEQPVYLSFDGPVSRASEKNPSFLINNAPAGDYLFRIDYARKNSTPALIGADVVFP